jgi:hypothetical protein
MWENKPYVVMKVEKRQEHVQAVATQNKYHWN